MAAYSTKSAVDLDKIVDYRAEYAATIQKYKVTGEDLIGLCPFHQDESPSFSVNLKTGQWFCHAENEGGNFVTFWARTHNVDTGTAYQQILEKYHVSVDKPTESKKEKKTDAAQFAPYTLDQYSFEKRLPVAFLKEICRLSTGKDRKTGTPYLRIPYYGTDGKESTYRMRYGNKDFRWKYGSTGKICLYGAWRLQEFSPAGYVVLVEGESDTQSLWYMGIPAIGVPGASMFKPEQAAQLQDLTLYIHQEPDKGGETFVTKVCRGLREGGFVGTVKVWKCSTLGVKDPSDLYMQHGKEEAAELIRKALRGAAPLDYTREEIPEVIRGAPIQLRQPEGWVYSDDGIFYIDDKKVKPVLVCRTPILLTKRLRDIETGAEKIEIAFKRDNRWQSAIYPRSTIFQSRSITALADLGCTITSENSKKVVSFLGALEAENADIIPVEDSTGSFGWQPGDRFIPGRAEGVTLDIDPSQRNQAAAYHTEGSMEGWTQLMAPHRSRHRFRFILASSFAAPLLKLVKQRTFWVYNWGDSRGGKTAALKAALSVWGDAEKMMVSFNATQVGLERTAALYCDLPIGVDERQTTGKPISETIYTMSSSIGRTRGAKGGGLQQTSTWNAIFLATGEEPAVKDDTMTGVSTRVLELFGGPFTSEQDAGEMHQRTTEDFGWAGPAFVNRVISIGTETVKAAYDRMKAYTTTITRGRNGSHAASVAVVALADAMVDSWVFGAADSGPSELTEDDQTLLQKIGIREASWKEAQRMADSILVEQARNNSTDVNERALQFIVDWIYANINYFGVNTFGTSSGICYGVIKDDESVVYILKSYLTDALKAAGFDPKKTLQYLKTKGLISTSFEKDGTERFSVLKRLGGGANPKRCVEFFLGKLTDDDDVAEAEYDDSPIKEGTVEPMQTAFRELDLDEELPF